MIDSNDKLFNQFRILRPGGMWVNLGPLLYHYSDVSWEGSIEPTYEDLLLIISGIGFQILVIKTVNFIIYRIISNVFFLFLLCLQKNEVGIKTKYAQNPRSMQQSEYSSIFFVCKKPELTEDQHEYQNGNR